MVPGYDINLRAGLNFGITYLPDLLASGFIESKVLGNGDADLSFSSFTSSNAAGFL